MIHWEHFIGEYKKFGHSYKVNKYYYIAKYEDLRDVKGRTPGHYFTINVNENGEYHARQQAQRDQEDFGAYVRGKDFPSLDEAKAYQESQMAKAIKAVYKNKQFHKHPPQYRFTKEKCPNCGLFMKIDIEFEDKGIGPQCSQGCEGWDSE